jgi:hypothetical protein
MDFLNGLNQLNGKMGTESSLKAKETIRNGLHKKRVSLGTMTGTENGWFE